MTFTYTPATVNDVTRVRFHTSDTVEGENYLSDEEISMMLSESGSWQKAVIACLKYIIGRLSQPDFKADWLQVSNAEAIKGKTALLGMKRQEFGIPAITGGVQHVTRYDSAIDDE